MLLPAYALMAPGTQVHVAAWPSALYAGPKQLIARAFAAHRACYAMETCALLQSEDATEEFQEVLRARSEIPRLAHVSVEGCAKIIDPTGGVVAEAPIEEVLIATVSVSL